MSPLRTLAAAAAVVLPTLSWFAAPAQAATVVGPPFAVSAAPARPAAPPATPPVLRREAASDGSIGNGPLLRSVTPARLADTRDHPTVDGRFRNGGALGAGGVLDLQVAGRGGVPSWGAGAVVLTVTAVSPSAAGFVTVWPSGETRPTASNLNFGPGQTTPNTVIAKLGSGGKVSILNSFGRTNVVVDVTAWLPTGAGYNPLSPARLADTRGFSTVDGLNRGFGTLPPGLPVDLSVLSRGGVPATGVAAVVLNVTAVPGPAAAGWASMWPSDNPAAAEVRVSFDVGRTAAAMTVLAPSADGRVTIQHDGGDPAHYVVDVLGWFAASPLFATVVPSGRVVATSAGGSIASIAATGSPEVPTTGIGTVLLNVTARSYEGNPRDVPPTFVSAWPSGQNFPGTSMLNLGPDQAVATGLVPTRIGDDGGVALLASQGTVSLTVSVIGWFGDGTSVPTTGGRLTSADSAALVAGVNAWRAAGRMCGGTPYPPVAALRWNAALETASWWHADDMARRNYFAHSSPEGVTPWDRMRAAGYRFGAAGENIAAGSATVNAVLANWLDSPGHCANLMSPGVTELGAARAGRTGSAWTWYWALLVATPG